MIEPEERSRAQAKLPPPAWLAAFGALALIVGAISGAVVALVLEDDGASGGPGSLGRLPASADLVAQATAFALPAVVTVINEHTPSDIDSGSGVIVDERGYIVTNEHVIKDSTRLTVQLANGEFRPATVVSHDAPFTDLAVIRITPGGLKALKFGDSTKLVPGETVISIGSALYEFKNSVSVGVVSGLGRRYLREGVFMEDLIQTDAAVNVGDSGGPVVSTAGEVIGINANVVRRIGNIDTIYGISFAISSKTIEPIVQSIIERGAYPRPYFGIDHVDIDATNVQQLGSRSERGAYVQRVIAGGPAAQAGIRPGDVIVKIGNRDVSPDMPFINALSYVAPNQRVPVQVFRDGQVGSVTLEMPPR